MPVYRVDHARIPGTDGGEWFFDYKLGPGQLFVTVRLPEGRRLSRSDFVHDEGGWHDVLLSNSVPDGDEGRTLSTLIGTYDEGTGRYHGGLSLLEIASQVRRWAGNVIEERVSAEIPRWERRNPPMVGVITEQWNKEISLHAEARMTAPPIIDDSIVEVVNTYAIDDDHVIEIAIDLAAALERRLDDRGYGEISRILIIDRTEGRRETLIDYLYQASVAE
ncbi:hypothetical protein [Jiella sp. M17.18]|uniref:hypothetical protein n=1 Tax=Jiella sp. M17.18 TaxID=3234247 RepID=UPI0034DF022C